MADSSHSSPTAAAAAGDSLLAPPTSDAPEAALPAADPSRSSPTAVAAAGDSLLAPPTSEAPEAALPAAGPDLDAEFGFQRPDFMTEPLAGTVGFHERHVFVVHNNIETTGSDSLPRILAAAIKARRTSLKKTIKLSICEGGGPMLSVGDVLLFPDMIRYRGLTHFDVGNFVEEVLVKDVEWLPGSPEAIKGSYVFVCTHGSRDKRCGVCGPALITRFKEEIKGNQVVVSACSHAGGHTLAAHAIIFSSFANGEVAGHWYGYVSPGDVPMLLDRHIGQGEILDHLWRGQLGMTQEEQKKLLELKTGKNGVAIQEPSAKEANGTDGAACNGVLSSGSWLNDVQDEYQNKSVPVEGNCKGSTTTLVEIELANQHVGTSNDPSLELAPVMKLKIPDSFNGNAILNVSKLHRFVHARDLQAAVNSCDNWLTSKLSFALIDNGKLFAVQADTVRDYLFQEGAVCVVPKSELQLVVPTKRLYSNSTTLKEHKPEESSLGDMKMVKSEFGGKKWLRRTYSVKGNDDYAVLQWRLRNWDDELELEHNAEPEEPQEAIDVDLIKQNKAEKALAQMDAKPKQSNKSIDVDSSMQEKVLPQAGDDFSIKNCIAIASTYKLSVEEMAKAGDIFRLEENRQIFVCFDSVTRLVWLRNQMAIPD